MMNVGIAEEAPHMPIGAVLLSVLERCPLYEGVIFFHNCKLYFGMKIFVRCSELSVNGGSIVFCILMD